MESLVRLLFALPLSVMAVIALALGWFGYQDTQNRQKQADQKMLIADQPQPALSNISAFDPKPEGKALVEANLNARWAFEHNTELTTTSKSGATESKGVMMVFMDETAGPTGDNKVAAVIVTDTANKEALMTWMMEHLRDEALPYPQVQLEGLVGTRRESDHVDKVLAENNLTRAANFFYLEPYLKGRDAALARVKERVAEGVGMSFLTGMAILIGGIAALRLCYRLVATSVRGARASGGNRGNDGSTNRAGNPQPARDPAPARGAPRPAQDIAPQQVPPQPAPDIASNDFIARIRARQPASNAAPSPARSSDPYARSPGQPASGPAGNDRRSAQPPARPTGQRQTPLQFITAAVAVLTMVGLAIGGLQNVAGMGASVPGGISPASLIPTQLDFTSGTAAPAAVEAPIPRAPANVGTPNPAPVTDTPAGPARAPAAP